MASRSKKLKKTDDELRSYKLEWEDTFPVHKNAKGHPTCLLCHEEFAQNKKSNLERHFSRKHPSFMSKYPEGEARKRAIVDLMKKQSQVGSSFTSWKESANDVNKATFVLSYEIGKSSKPYSDGEFIKNCFVNVAEVLFANLKNKEEIFRKLKQLPLSAQTVQRRILSMSNDIHIQQLNDVQSATAISISADESCDIIDTAQVALFVRYISTLGPKEELFGIIALKGQTRGEDLAEAVKEFLQKNNVNMEKIVSIATDGARSMTGSRQGFVSRISKEIGHDVLNFHCIIHQEALCAQIFPDEVVQVMNKVIKMVNSILASSLNHRQFRDFLDEVGSEAKDLLLHNKVRWLSRGNVLARFAELLEEIKVFLIEKGMPHQELEDSAWLQKFFFMVDMTGHLNALNKKLQGRGKIASSMLEDITSFENKLSLFSRDIGGSLLHFPSLKTHKTKSQSEIDVKFFKDAILKMRDAFLKRFQEFRGAKETLSFVTKPLTANVEELKLMPFNVNRAALELELLDVANKDIWSSKFKQLTADLEELERKRSAFSLDHQWVKLQGLEKDDDVVFKAWDSLPTSYCEMRRLAFGVLTIFGSTYSCEQLFSNMNIIKSKLRNRLTDENLNAALKLKTSSYLPDINSLSKEMQAHSSH